MAKTEASLVGIGLYTVPEAAAIAGVPAPSIRRWMRGYSYRYRGQERRSSALWEPDIAQIDGMRPLSFLDMMEARFVQAFRKAHVSWSAIREAASLARDIFNDRHPFTSLRFQTDGNRIFAQIEEKGQIKLFDMNRRAWVFRSIVAPSLYKGVEFEHDQPARWYPLHPNRAIDRKSVV